MYAKTITVGVLIALLLSGPVAALTVLNEDDDMHVVTVTHGDETQQVEVAGGGEAEIDCAEGCTLRLASGDEADFGDEDEVVINGGTFTITE